MAISTSHVLHGVNLGGSTFISQIQSGRPATNVQRLVAESAGLPYPLFTATMGVNPAFTLEATQLKSLLDLTGAVTGIADLSGGNTDLYFKKVTDLGRRLADATAGHMRFRMSQAFYALDRITAGHNSEAVASGRVGTTYDGSNNPLVPAGSTALAGTPVGATHWLAGPVALNTVQLPGVADITIDFGRQVMEMGADGELYNTFAACMFYAPVVTIRSYEHCWATYGLNGTALTAMSLYLRKVGTTGRVADATAEHIKFTSSTGVIHVEESTGGGNEPSMTTVTVQLVSSSASTEPITVDTASAIT